MQCNSSQAVASLDHIRGETINFGLRASNPQFLGTETVTCHVKAAVNGSGVPAPTTAPLATAVATFTPASGNTPSDWKFTLSPSQTAALAPGAYITDAKIVFASGHVDYPKPIVIRISERVTV